jgi:hypothetical protein
MSRRLPAALVAFALAATIAVPLALATTQGRLTTQGRSSTQGRTFVVYAKPTRAQFIDHNDDRERSNIRNPFNPDTPPPPPNANSAKKGARAGDNALFSFKVYADYLLTRPIGTAIYSCTFNFSQEAICEVNFTLKRGTMIALGPTKLDTANIILPVIGGTGRYAGAHGQFTSRPAPGNKKNTQIVRFRLL